MYIRFSKFVLVKGGSERLNIVDIIKSVLMSFLGVQKESARERDFRKGRPVDFILVGLLATVVFVIMLYSIVRLVLMFAGLS